MADKLWRVTGTRESSRLATSGGFEDILIVSFDTGTGASGTVTVPKRLATPEYIGEEIQEYVDRLDAIHNL